MVIAPTFPAWSTGVDEKLDENKSTKKPVFQMTNQEKGIFWMAELSQVQISCRNQICNHQKSFHHPDSCCHSHLQLSPSFTSIRIHLCKVLGNKVLPLFCLIAILAYWTLGLALPAPEDTPDVANCISPA